MKMRDALQDILRYVARIEKTASEGEEAFYADYRNQDSIIRQYEVIGEIVKRLPSSILDQAPEVNWSQIKGFRDFLAHNYDRIELQVVWSAVQKLPSLKSAVEKLLDGLPPEEDNP